MNNTLMHEAGHAVFANIFKDYLVIQEITILPGHYGRGANLVGTIKFHESAIDHFHFIIVNLAGLVVEFSSDKRRDEGILKKILMYLDKRLSDNDNTSDSFDGDFKNIQEPLNKLSVELRKSKKQILACAMVYIANCLIKTREFWPAIDALASELNRAKTLDSTQIERLFNSIGFNQYLLESRTAFLDESKSLLFDERHV